MLVKSSVTIILFIVSILFGCATKLHEKGVLVRETTLDMVASCEFMGTISGSSGWGGLSASTGMKSVLNQIKNKAGVMGASHVVLDYIQGGNIPSGTGKAYLCKN